MVEVWDFGGGRGDKKTGGGRGPRPPGDSPRIPHCMMMMMTMMMMKRKTAHKQAEDRFFYFMETEDATQILMSMGSLVQLGLMWRQLLRCVHVAYNA